ncbi:hypothetical protein B0A49_09579 [Cryomyces minteri]|uniref:Carrier domain-containing protein n=1 Tax=Cryomyces minteri TaxID=331657 RepID=A0A4U0WM86_9PEZI|nr:hypothetical protein B0A49_09579 [Cryomyces minteri]
MGANDIRYPILILAGQKTVYKTLLTSPRNSDVEQLSLMQRTKCTKFFHSTELGSKVQSLKESTTGLETWTVPSYAEMTKEEVKLYPYTKSFDEAENDPVIVLHTSGSTGLPKPIIHTNGWWSCADSATVLPVPEGRLKMDWTMWKPDDHFLLPSPLFNAIGNFFLTVTGVFSGPTPVLLNGVTASVDALCECIERTKPRAGMLAPSIIEEMSNSDRGYRALGTLEYIMFGGAPLAPSVGDRVSKVSRLILEYGSTEAGIFPLLLNPAEYWQWFEVAPAYGAEFEATGDGLFELIIPRSESKKQYHAVFRAFPELQEWRTKDLFEKHPTKPNLYLFRGRVDDVIVLRNALKFKPVTMEKMIEGHSLLHGALVVGQGRLQTALIIEPDWTKFSGEKDPQDLIDELWPRVEHANRVSPAHAQVYKSKILVAKHDKPFRRSPKGSMMRNQTLTDYADEIDALYAREESYQLGDLPEDFSPATMGDFVRRAVSLLLPKAQLSDDSDFVSVGLDSLQTTTLASALTNAVKPYLQGASDAGGSHITTRTVYQHPTINKLSEYLMRVINTRSSSSNGTINHEAVRVRNIRTMVEEYTRDLPKRTRALQSAPGNHVVVLTGSTGSLGCYILQTLLEDSKTKKVYCLNRSPNAELRQNKTLEERGILLSQPGDPKVEYLQADLSHERFGLDVEKYEELKHCVDIVIHNAWKVDFNYSLESFKDTHLQGTRRLVDFGLESKSRAHIHLISSIAAAGNWNAHHEGELPEVLLDDDNAPAVQGYGESKYVAEQILATASRACGLPASILRVGQIAGPTTDRGMWNRHEWVPSLIVTSRALGKMPSSLGSLNVVDWVPVDRVAQIVVDLVHARLTSQSSKSIDVFHVVNPRKTTWQGLIPTVQSYFQDGSMELVDIADWIQALESVQWTSGEVADRFPAVKLLDFYRSLQTSARTTLLATNHTVASSSTMAGLEAVNGALMTTWMQQWGF